MKKLILTILLVTLFVPMVEAKQITTARLFVDADNACSYKVSTQFSFMDVYTCVYNELTSGFNYYPGYSEQQVADINLNLLVKMSGAIKPMTREEEKASIPLLIKGFQSTMGAAIPELRKNPQLLKPMTPELVKTWR